MTTTKQLAVYMVKFVKISSCQCTRSILESGSTERVYMTEKEKYLQIRKEAMWTGIVLAVLIGFWLLAGFGLSGLDIRVFGLPIWAIGGTVGVWIFAMVLVKLLTAFVFKDFPLEDSGEGDQP